MRVKRLAVCAAVCIAVLPGAAQADTKVVQKLTITSPQIAAMLKNMAPAQRAVIARAGMDSILSGTPTTVTTYIHGGEVRADIGPQSVILSGARHSMTVLDRANHTYTVSRYSLLSDRPTNIRVHRTGRKKLIAHHSAQEYAVTLKSPGMPGAAMSGDIWSAADLPQPPVSVFTPGTASGVASEFRQIPGMPLAVNLTVTGSPMGATVVHMTTVSVTSGVLPASLFTTPSGYRKVAATAMGGAGSLP